MNVYQKLQKCRVRLKAVEIKESGNNTFAKYTYMELGDFLPHITDLCDEFNLCPVISFGAEATLTIINAEKPEEQIVFASPMSTADLKGCHAIQNLGAVETYLRRYLYVAAFDIVEHDALDSTQGKEKEQRQQAPRPPQQAANVDPKDAEYHQRIKDALKAIYGDDKATALDKIEDLTAWTTKEGKAMPGVRDFTKKTGKGAQILCHQLEKLAGITA